MATKTKHCGGCGKTKSRLKFYGAVSNRDGLQSQCKDCMKAHARRQYREGRASWTKNAAERAASREKWMAIAKKAAASL